jgi:hypothetical protein
LPPWKRCPPLIVHSTSRAFRMSVSGLERSTTRSARLPTSMVPIRRRPRRYAHHMIRTDSLGGAFSGAPRPDGGGVGGDAALHQPLAGQRISRRAYSQPGDPQMSRRQSAQELRWPSVRMAPADRTNQLGGSVGHRPRHCESTARV